MFTFEAESFVIETRNEGSGNEVKWERRVRWKWARERKDARAVGRRRWVENRLEVERMWRIVSWTVLQFLLNGDL
jgi:hypothetical protein